MQNIQEFINQCQQDLTNEFQLVDEVAYANFKKIHKAFQENRVALRHFSGTTGYGYDDVGRDTLCKIFADVFGCEKAIFSPNIVSGTHAISLCLFGILRPNDVLLSISGEIYDTLENVVKGSGIGSLKDFNIDYDQINLLYCMFLLWGWEGWFGGFCLFLGGFVCFFVGSCLFLQ